MPFSTFLHVFNSLQIGIFVYLSGHLSVIGERRYETANCYLATVSKQFRYFGHPPDVLLSIRLAEAQILIEARTNVVAIQSIRWNAVRHKKRFQFKCDRCLARPTQPSQPYCAAAKATTKVLSSNFTSNMMLLFAHIGRHLKALSNEIHKNFRWNVGWEINSGFSSARSLRICNGFGHMYADCWRDYATVNLNNSVRAHIYRNSS